MKKGSKTGTMSKEQDIRERILKFLSSWLKGFEEQVHVNTTLTWQSLHNSRETWQAMKERIEDWEIVQQVEITPVVTDVVVKVKLRGEEKTIVCRCTKEIEPYKTGNDKEGVWGVNPISAIRNLF